MKVNFTPECLPESAAHLSAFQRQVVCVSLNKMLNKDWFDITVIDKIIQILDINKDKDFYPYFSLLHCVHYAEMGKEVYEELVNNLICFLGIKESCIDVEAVVVDKASSSVSRSIGFIQRLTHRLSNN